MSSARSEANPSGVSVVLGSQNRISCANICFQDKFCLSPSEHTRAYYVSDDTHKICVEIRNIKENKPVKIETNKSIMAMALTPDGDLITAEYTNLTRWKNILSPTPTSVPLELKSDVPFQIRCMQFSPAGELITGHSNGEVLCWDLSTGRSRLIINVKNCKEIHFDEKENLTCINEDDKRTYCLDKDFKLVGTIEARSLADNIVRLSQDQIATALMNVITIWDIKTKKEIGSIETKYCITFLSTSPEGLLVANEIGGLIEFFNVITREKIHDVQLVDSQWSRSYWNRFGYLTCSSEKVIIDIKCDIINRKDVSDALLQFLSVDATSVVLPYLFFTPSKQIEQAADSQSELKPRIT